VERLCGGPDNGSEQPNLVHEPSLPSFGNKRSIKAGAATALARPTSSGILAEAEQVGEG
jgi:hypothetical protein